MSGNWIPENELYDNNVNHINDKKCTKNHHFYLWRDPKVSPIGICACQKERLDRIEAVYQKYKHMDRVLCDTEILDIQHDITDLMLYDLWQAIRRDE